MTQARRKRPKDRREQIARVAAEDFSRKGYHGVGIEQIATSLDISGPAVYRHFPNKYALLEHAISATSDALCHAVRDAAHIDDADRRVEAIIGSALSVAFTRRNTGGLFRWEQRLLVANDRVRIRAQLTEMIETFTTAAQPIWPDVERNELILRCVGAISVTGSVTAHRTVLAQKRAEVVLTHAASKLLDLPKPAVPYRHTRLVTIDDETGRHEQVLASAIELIFRHGFHDVSMGQIGDAVGIVPSGMYRYFASKSAILVGALERAGDAVAQATAAARIDYPDPRDRLYALAQAYVQLSFTSSQLMTVYFREIGSVPAADRRNLAAVQRANVAAFADAVGDVCPDLTDAEATFLVHAAFAVVFDVGRTRKFDPAPEFQAEVYSMVCAVLFSAAPTI